MRKLALSICALSLAVPLCGSVWAAGGSGEAVPEKDKTTAAAPATQPAEPAQPAAAAATPALAAELAELRVLLREQAEEIEAQRHELAEMKARMAAPSPAPAPAPAPAPIAVIQPVAPADTVISSGSVLGDYVDAAPPQDKESPLALHFKGITLTPGGFAAAETVYRNRAVDSDVNTAFLSVPFSASNLSRISEFNFSGRQSRIAMLMEGKLSNVKIGGYYEGDFLSAGVTSNNRQSNSYTFRQRQFWAQARFDSGWIITGGQMWSLVTETRKGMDNRTEATPLTIDAQYQAGFDWTRQYGFRVVKNINDKIWLGFSVEEAQEVVATLHGNANNFVIQDTGNAAGLYNNTTNYTLNPAPDFVLKMVFEPGGGWGHWEVFGLLRDFRARNYPCIVPANVIAPAACTGQVNTFLANNDSRTGGAVGGSFRIPLFNKKVDIGLKGLYGDGVGRYGDDNLPDITIRPRGTIAPIHGGSGLATIEWHATPKLDVYGYYGADFVKRAYYVTLAGTPTVPPVSIGYGSPYFVDSGCQSPTEVAPGANLPAKAANCTGDLRNVQESTLGFWHRLYKGDRGTMQWGMQYSYLKLTAWSGLGTPGVAGVFPQYHPHANDNMFFTSFRYYLP